jgi:hypothetical protein
MRTAIAAVWSAVLLGVPIGARAEFVVVASEGTAGVTISGVDPSIAEDGTVAFIGGAEKQLIYVGSPDTPAALTTIDLTTFGLTEATSVHTQAGYVVFIARRGDDFPATRGVYALPLAGGPLRTLIEGCSGDFCEPDSLRGPREFYSRSLAISPNGTVAFSTVTNGAGAIYRGPVEGSASILQPGSADGGFVFNTINLDVNDECKVTVQSEYSLDMGLRRGIFVLQVPNETAPEVQTVLHNLNVGNQPEPSFAANSHVLYGRETNGTVDAIIRGIGVPYGDHPDGAPVGAEVLIDDLGPYAYFGRLNPIDQGVVVGAEAGNFAFEAFLEDARHGVFTGADPVANGVLVDGDAVSGGVVRAVSLGSVNSNGQVVLLVEVERGPDDLVTEVLRFDPEVCPPPKPPKPHKRHRLRWLHKPHRPSKQHSVNNLDLWTFLSGWLNALLEQQRNYFWR